MLRCGSKDIPTLPIRPLMLQPSRDPSSKLHELIHARTLEKRLKKRRLPPKTRVGLLQRQRGEVFSDSPERKIEPNRADDSGVLGHTRAMKRVLGPSKAWRPESQTFRERAPSPQSTKPLLLECGLNVPSQRVEFRQSLPCPTNQSPQPRRPHNTVHSFNTEHSLSRDQGKRKRWKHAARLAKSRAQRVPP